ncbi:MAG: L(+)-tartrate dehydratase subunit beta [Deltaproteobacteria bacterium ADurb.Bin072]|jgi:fumarate hydratase class I|nr:MAG: L(+)-tartrate dehydratase subunit beta [Deltaproteobacteria bacterium ADurb.Bin072]
MDLKRISSPLSAEVIGGLAVGDMVSLSGTVVTGRDQVHKYLASGGTPPVDLEGLVIYHCGPVVIEEKGAWKITAAGPTTSIREEPYEPEVIARFRPGAIMGKGGMGGNTRAALKEHGCVYLHVVGGAAQYLAERIVRVQAVHLEEFGQPESLWVLSVQDLPALVTMDARGGSLHDAIQTESLRRLHALFEHRFAGSDPL